MVTSMHPLQPSNGQETNLPTTRRLRNEQCGIREGAGTAVMQGAGENFFTAFALTFNATTFQIGLLNALPAFVGTFAQLVSVMWLRWFGHRHAIVIAGAAAQAVLWLPLLLLPFLFPEHGVILIIACAVSLVIVGHFSIPAWNSLITDLLDPNTRGAYFAKRARIMSATSFAALLMGGLLLSWTKQHQIIWVGFATLFLVAAAARGFAAHYLQRLDESDAPVTEHRSLRLQDFVVTGRHEAFLRFLLFSGFMHISALLAGPYSPSIFFAICNYPTWNIPCGPQPQSSVDFWSLTAGDASAICTEIVSC